MSNGNYTIQVDRMEKLMTGCFRLMLACLLITSIMAGAYAQEETQGEELPVSSENLTRPEPMMTDMIPLLEEKTYAIPLQAMITGNGSLEKSIEINNTEGGRILGMLEVGGTDETRWEYQFTSQNTSGPLILIGDLDVTNANYVFFQGQSLSPGYNTAYSGVEILGDDRKEPETCSVRIRIVGATLGNTSYSVLEMINATGSIYAMNRGYSINERNQEVQDFYTHIPVRTLRISDNVTTPDLSPVRNRRSQADLILEPGTMKSYVGYSGTTTDEVFSFQVPDVTEGSLYTSRTRAYGRSDEESQEYYSSNEALRATDVTSLIHNGYALNLNGSCIAMGSTNAQSDRMLEKTIYVEGIKGEVFSGADQGIQILGSSHNPGSEHVAIPVTYSGWYMASFEDGIYRMDSSQKARGAALSRILSAGINPEEAGMQYGVMTNSSAGASDSKGASSFTGSSECTLDTKRGNETVLKGRWIMNTPEGMALTRSISAMMPGAEAYDHSRIMTGTKYVNEQASYRDGTVDVS